LEGLTIGFPLGILYANALEWGLHRFVLHGLGRRKDSFFAFHFNGHHRKARKFGMVDAAYERPAIEGPFPGAPQTREVLSLIGLGMVHAPLAWVAPWFSLGLLYSGINYYRVHRRAHLEPAWAREHVPWHVDHHMGPDQDANWCVTKPWFDLLMGTRQVSRDHASANLPGRRAA